MVRRHVDNVKIRSSILLGPILECDAMEPSGLSKTKLVGFDWDGTLSVKNSWDLITESLGCSSRVKELEGPFRRKEIDYATWCKSDADIFEEFGLTKEKLTDICKREFRLHNGAIETINELRSRGIKIGIVSGGVYNFYEYAANELGLRVDYVSFAGKLNFNEHGRLAAVFLTSFDVSTLYPLLLFLMDSKLSSENLNKISIILESYLLRRTICGFTAKNYNHIFLGLTRFLQEKTPTPNEIHKYLAGLSGESAEWPTDEAFLKAWQINPTYYIGNSKTVYILRRLSDSYLTSKSEDISITGQLSVEHIMPQQWQNNWPLPDGSKGLTWTELNDEKEGDQIADATRKRDVIIQTLGNLTILTQPLNSAVSNAAWINKKPKLLESSLLPINLQLNSYTKWDEESIQLRSKELFERAKLIWPKSTVILSS
jgi:HAD superfamily phosphoserine phosphatase-like hydrolase